MGNIGSSYTKLVALEAGALILTDMFLDPFFASSEITYLLKLALQAWIFLKIKDNNYRHYYQGSGEGVGPAIPSLYN